MRLSKLVLSAALVLCAASTSAQTTPEGSHWQHVQALPAGTTVHIRAKTASASCSLKTVDADSLTCTRVKDLTFQRTDIRSIRISRRMRSTLVGGAIGAGVGLGVGAAAHGWATKSKGAGVGAAIFTPVGLMIGAATDFTRETVYRAQ